MDIMCPLRHIFRCLSITFLNIFIHQMVAKKENTKNSINNTINTHYVQSQNNTVLAKCIDLIIVFTNKFLRYLTVKLGNENNSDINSTFELLNNFMHIRLQLKFFCRLLVIDPEPLTVRWKACNGRQYSQYSHD